MSGTDPLRVIRDWTATYADPIRVAAGDVVVLSGRRDVWDGRVWIWARAPDGREGWIPDDAVRQADGGSVATTGFDAREMTCRSGERVVVVAETHGWVLCSAPDGRRGWVPRAHLEGTGEGADSGACDR